jgi:hypothetical protein
VRVSLAVAICTGIVAVIIAGPWALAYLAIYVLATLPGIPIGGTLFGRHHPAAWISGALMGYGLTCVAFWTVLALRVPSLGAFVVAWAAMVALSWGSSRALVRRAATPPAAIPLPGWSGAEARALVLLLLIVPAVFLFPYKNLGARDEQGNRLYRAYFTADFIWHTALTAELTKYDMPPINPYLGDRTIHYYWTYFLVPAVVAHEGPDGLRDVQTVLKVNALCSGMLFIAALILATWTASFSAAGTALAVIIAVLAASAEGIYAVWDLIARGRPLDGLTNLNIDAMSAWEFSGLRIDGLVRSMWYNPQHSMSAALGLVAMPVAGLGGVTAPLSAIGVAGLALALSTTFNPLIGGLLSLIYGLVILADAVRSRQLTPVLHHAIAAGCVALAVVWCIGNDMVEGAAGAMVYGFGGYARNAPVATLMISLGPLLIPALLALWPPSQLPRRTWPALAGTVAGLLIFYFVRLSVDAAYIGFRAGQILQLSLPGLAALFFARLWMVRSGRALAIALARVTRGGLPTTLIDSFNAQDIHNLRMGPAGGRWRSHRRAGSFPVASAHATRRHPDGSDCTTRRLEPDPTFAGRRTPPPDFPDEHAGIHRAITEGACKYASGDTRPQRLPRG